MRIPEMARTLCIPQPGISPEAGSQKPEARWMEQANADICRTHDHTIPGLDLPTGLLVDVTNDGVLWDPTLNAYAYSYDAATATFDPYDASFPVSWLSFNGHWGDDALPGGPELFGLAKYTAGPVGPQFKGLVREEVCPSKPCVVWPFRTLDEHELEGQDGS